MEVRRCAPIPLHEARSQLSTLIDRALAGEPQPVTRHGKDAMVFASETTWDKQSDKTSPLADLLLETIGKGGVADVIDPLSDELR